MSLVELEMDDFVGNLQSYVNNHEYVAFIGSRSVKNDEDVMQSIRDAAEYIAHQLRCKIVSGGAYGADQASMEGSLNVPLHALNPIIPLSSRNAGKIKPLLYDLTGDMPLVDSVECFFSTDRLIVFYPDFTDGYHPGKYFERDEKIARVVSAAIAFWDGKSRGTKKTVDYAIREGKKVYVIKV